MAGKSMKSTKYLLLLVAPLLSGCIGSNQNQTEQSNTSTSQKEPSTTTQTSQSSQTSTSGEIDTSKIDSISLSDHNIEIKAGKRSDAPLVYFKYNVPESEITDKDKEVSWEISDKSLASVDEYGRVTGISYGKTILTCTSKEGKRRAYATVYVYDNDHPISKKWKKISDTSDLEIGSELIIADPQTNKAANENDTGMYLHSCDVTSSSDGSELINFGDAARFVLGEDYRGRNGYTLEAYGRKDGSYLATTHTEKISFYDTPKVSAVLWDIFYDKTENCWDIRSATIVDGWLMYNVLADRFTTYTSNEQTGKMHVVSLYKLSYE